LSGALDFMDSETLYHYADNYSSTNSVISNTDLSELQNLGLGIVEGCTNEYLLSHIRLSRILIDIKRLGGDNRIKSFLKFVLEEESRLELFICRFGTKSKTIYHDQYTTITERVDVRSLEYVCMLNEIDQRVQKIEEQGSIENFKWIRMYKGARQ
jgi:hypothetical protein